MSAKQQKESSKRFLMVLGGSFVLILGITLVLAWWQYVVMLFKGLIGMVLALAGLVMLYVLSKK